MSKTSEKANIYQETGLEQKRLVNSDTLFSYKCLTKNISRKRPTTQEKNLFIPVLLMIFFSFYFLSQQSAGDKKQTLFKNSPEQSLLDTLFAKEFILFYHMREEYRARINTHATKRFYQLLHEKLKAKNSMERLRAFIIITMIEQEIPTFILADFSAVLKNNDPQIQRKALYATGDLGKRIKPLLPLLFDFLRSAGSEFSPISTVFSKVSKHIIPELLDVYEKHPSTRAEILSFFDFLEETPDELVELFLKVAEKEKDKRVRLAGIGALGSVKTPSQKILKKLLELLKVEKDKNIQEELLLTIALTIRNRGIVILKGGYTRIQLDKRQNPLGKITRDTINLVCLKLKSSSSKIKLVALIVVEDLLKISSETPKAFISALAPFFEEKDIKLRKMVVRVISRNENLIHPFLPKLLKVLKEEIDSRLLKLTEPSASISFESDRVQIDFLVLEAFQKAEQNFPKIEPFLKAALKNKDLFLAQMAAVTLIKMGIQTEAIKALFLDALRSKNEFVQLSAFEVLAKVGKKAEFALEIVFKIFKTTRSGNIETSAIEYLGKIGPLAKPAIPDLLKIIKLAGGSSTPAFAATAICKIDPENKKGIEYLINEITFQRTTQAFEIIPVRLTRKCGTLAKMAVPVLKKALENKNVFVGIEAAISLQKIASQETKGFTFLLEVLESKQYEKWYYKLEAIRALGVIGIPTQEILIALIKARKNPNEHVRASAQKLLLQLTEKKE